MAVETFLVRPQFREADEARIKWIFCYIVGDASIISVGLFHELLEMWESLHYALWREAQYSENRNCWVHLAFLLIDCFMRPNARGKPRRKERSEWRAPTRYGLASA